MNSSGDQVTETKVLPTFILKGLSKLQLNLTENKDVNFLPLKFKHPLNSIYGPFGHTRTSG